MTRNPERIDRLREELRRSRLDAFVCTFGARVLMLSGYWPVVGASFAIASRDGTVALLVPEDEKLLTSNSWADVVETYSPARLDMLQSVAQAAVQPLRQLLERLGLKRARIGYEHGPVSEPSSYAAMNLFGVAIVDVLTHASSEISLEPVDESLERLAAVKTPVEIERVRKVCTIAAGAFERGKRAVMLDATEQEIASAFRNGFSEGRQQTATARADGFAFCMSGENSFRACGAFAQTGTRRIGEGDLVLVHANSYADGYWTDITRTYVVGERNGKLAKWREAVFDARAAALKTIGSGVSGAAVDRAARDVLESRGLGKLFRHSTGHGVGLAAISANSRPRLHPKSLDILEEGMVFNVEPAVYLDGVGGMRHCDMVAIVNGRAKVLTPFQLKQDELLLPGRPRAA